MIWDGLVMGVVNVEFDVDLNEDNFLFVEHYGKSFGEDRIWHTGPNGDRNITIDQIRLGYVDIKDLLHLGYIVNAFNPKQLDDFNKIGVSTPWSKTLVHEEKVFMGYNSQYIFSFPQAVYDWIIIQKTPFMRPFDPDKQSSLNSVNWRLDWINSNEIQGLLKEVEGLIEQI
jgi:hypothetical protein